MGIAIDISGGTCVFLALLSLAVPLDWFLAAIAAALVHETAHILSVFFLGGRIYGVRIGILGVVLDASTMDDRRNLVCGLAGPAGSFALLSVSRFLPKVAVCGLIHGIFNLLPVYPLDGGRALECILRLILPPDKWETVCGTVRFAMRILLFLVTVYFSFYDHWSVLYGVMILFGVLAGKISCKEGQV